MKKKMWLVVLFVIFGFHSTGFGETVSIAKYLFTAAIPNSTSAVSCIRLDEPEMNFVDKTDEITRLLVTNNNLLLLKTPKTPSEVRLVLPARKGKNVIAISVTINFVGGTTLMGKETELFHLICTKPGSYEIFSSTMRKGNEVKIKVKEL